MERSYPFEHKNREAEEKYSQESAAGSRVIGAGDVSKADTADIGVAVKGKGRRDGNSAASRVIHSGNVSERARAIHEREAAKENAGKGRSYPFEHKAEKSDRSYSYDDKHYEKRSSGFYGHEHSEKKSYGRTDKKSFGKKERFDAANDLRGRQLLLKAVENSEVGCFLELNDGKKILLPFAEQTHRPEIGEEVSVSIYEDKGGRLTATMRKPLVSVGETGVLTVAAVTKIGAFADNGMPKQVLIPYKEMLHTPKAGDQVLVSIYLDKSGRQAGTMRVYRNLKKGSAFREGDRVEGFVYEIKPELGAFVAVDEQYYGMVPAKELFTSLHYGDRITARVSKVREDGKLDLLLREKLYLETDKDAEKILQKIRENGGVLPYADKADAELILNEFSMSKNQFKRALGALYKKKLIEIDRENDTVRLCL